MVNKLFKFVQNFKLATNILKMSLEIQILYRSIIDKLLLVTGSETLCKV